MATRLMPNMHAEHSNLHGEQIDMPTSGMSVGTELFRLHLRHWRTSMLGGVFTYGITAWMFGAYMQQGHLWWWAVAAWTSTAVMAALCVWVDRRPTNSELSHPWLLAMTCCTTVIGLLWGALPWCLPGEQTNLQIVAAALIAVALAGGVTTSGSRLISLTFSMPIAVLTPAALAWHAQLPIAALAALTFFVILIQYGLRFQAALVSGIVERRRAQALLEQLENEQAKRREIEKVQTVAAERQRLMREIHDGLGSALSSTLAVAERGKLERDDLAAVLRDCLDELRVMMDSLDSASDDIVTLLANLRFRLGRRLEGAGIRVVWQMDDLPRLAWMGSEQALYVARIVQELLANVGKHSGASYVSVTATAIQDQIEVAVSDDGCGFDPHMVSRGRGLRSVKQRAESLGGSVEIESLPGKGTTTRLHLPIDKPIAAALNTIIP